MVSASARGVDTGASVISADSTRRTPSRALRRWMLNGWGTYGWVAQRVVATGRRAGRDVSDIAETLRRRLRTVSCRVRSRRAPGHRGGFTPRHVPLGRADELGRPWPSPRRWIACVVRDPDGLQRGPGRLTGRRGLVPPRPEKSLWGLVFRANG